MTYYGMKITRDTAANFTSNDPTLLSGELAYETDTGYLKVGDGVTAWTSLSYFSGDYVLLTGNQTVAGIKTFSSFPITPSAAPTTDYQVANKKYVDDTEVSSPLTTKGDVFTFSTVDARLPVGTNGYVLAADSTKATGLNWIPAAGVGDMTIAAYDPAGITEQLVGLTSTQELTNKTLTSPKINEDVAVTSTATELNLLDGITTLSGSNTGDQVAGDFNHDDLANITGTAAQYNHPTDAQMTVLGNTSNTNTGDQSAGDFNHDDLANITGTASQYNHPTDAQMTVLGNTSNTNTGDQTDMSSISDTKANFDSSLSDGSFAYSGGAFHDGFSDFVANEHIDWTTSQAPIVIHADNYTDTTYTATDFDIKDLTDSTSLRTTWNGKQDALSFGIADTNSVIINSATVADNDYAKFTATGLEGRSYSEVLSDIGALANVVEDTTPQLGGDLDAQDKHITGVGTVGFTQELDNGSKTTDATIDFGTDQKQKVTLTANTITLTLDTTFDRVGNYLLKIVNGGLATLTWASESGSVYWAGGTEPTWTSSGTDIATFYYDGTNWYGVGSLDFS